jgi:glycosyltransferase involved in cell wall biosynthesis
LPSALSHLPSPLFGASPLDVLLLIRARAELYPPTVNQANLLAGCGLKVGVIHLGSSGGTSTALQSSIRQWHAHSAWNPSCEPRPVFSKRWLNWFRFAWTCRSVIRASNPKVVVGYDPPACVQLRPASPRHRTVYHFHELPEVYPGMGFGPRMALRSVKHSTLGVDLVVFSDLMRARCYQEEARLPACPEVVMNCPVLLNAIPASPLRHVLAERQVHGNRIVCYLGCVGEHQGLPGAALGMRYWPTDSVLVLVGPYPQTVQEEILAGAHTAGTASRVVFLGPHPHVEALALAAGADLGLSLIQPHNKNRLYSAGAVNKRFEYMALGLPQLTNTGPGVADIVERNACGLCVDPNSPEEIGMSVRSLLCDQNRLRSMGEQGRKAHLDCYNYQVQFRPVQDWITARCAPSD